MRLVFALAVYEAVFQTSGKSLQSSSLFNTLFICTLIIQLLNLIKPLAQSDLVSHCMVTRVLACDRQYARCKPLYVYVHNNIKLISHHAGLTLDELHG